MSKDVEHEKCLYDYLPSDTRRFVCVHNKEHRMIILDCWREARLREMLRNDRLTGLARKEAEDLIDF